MSWRRQQTPPSAASDSINSIRQDVREKRSVPLERLQAVVDTLLASRPALSNTEQIAHDLAFLAQQIVLSPNTAPCSADSRLPLCSSYCNLIKELLAPSKPSPTPPPTPRLPSSAANVITAALRQLAGPPSTLDPQQQAPSGIIRCKIQQDALQALVSLLPGALPQLSPHERITTITLLASLLALAPPTASSHSSRGTSTSSPSPASAELCSLAANGLATCISSSKGTLVLSQEEAATITSSIATALQAAAASHPAEDAATTQLLLSLLRALNTAVMDGGRSWVQHTSSIVDSLRSLLSFGASDTPTSSSITTTRPQASSSTSTQADTLSRGPPSPSPSSSGRYQPPHLRRGSRSAEPDSLSDSDASDSEGLSGGIKGRQRASRVRLSALLCMQTMAKADSKALHPSWTILLPLQPPAAQRRSSTATLASAMLQDPIVKVRSMAAATIGSLMEGPAQRAFLAVAEARSAQQRQAVRGFTTLSASLGQMALALHAALLQSVRSETSAAVLGVVLRTLCTVLGAMPYERLPRGLLTEVVQAVYARQQQQAAPSMRDWEVSVADATAIQTASLACMAEALSTKTANLGLSQHLQQQQQQQQGEQLLSMVQHLLAAAAAPQAVLRVEALAALRGLAANYPFTLPQLWPQLLALAQQSIAGAQSASPAPSPRGQQQQLRTAALAAAAAAAAGVSTSGSVTAEEKSAQHAVKLLGDYLSAQHSQQLTQPSQQEQMWQDAAELLLPVATAASSATLRASAIAVFGEQQSDVHQPVPMPAAVRQQVLPVVCQVATQDAAAAVRAAACKALGAVCMQGGCIGQQQEQAAAAGGGGALSTISACLMAAVNDSAASVRIAAAWALGNLCDAIKLLRTTAAAAEQQQAWEEELSRQLPALAQAALHAAQDTEKVRSNGVRALGNLLVLLPAGSGTTSSSDSSTWRTSAVQCLHSCLATGNVKVQWNACVAAAALLRSQLVGTTTSSETRVCVDQGLGTLLLQLVMLLRDSQHYKVRIHAAAAICGLGPGALAAGMGAAFADALLVTAATLEAMEEGGSAAASAAVVAEDADSGKFPNYRYAAALIAQLKQTLLHLLGLLASEAACAASEQVARLRDRVARRGEYLVKTVAACAREWQQQLLQQQAEGAGSLPADPFGTEEAAAVGDAQRGVSGVADGVSSEGGLPVNMELALKGLQVLLPSHAGLHYGVGVL